MCAFRSGVIPPGNSQVDGPAVRRRVSLARRGDHPRWMRRPSRRMPSVPDVRPARSPSNHRPDQYGTTRRHPCRNVVHPGSGRPALRHGSAGVGRPGPGHAAEAPCATDTSRDLDDGPTTPTHGAVKALETSGAKAIFLIWGQRAAQNQKLLQAEADAGIGSPTHLQPPAPYRRSPNRHASQISRT
jgi:hypothetical protein